MNRLTFYDDGVSKSGLTHIWTVLNTNVELGRVSWFSHWMRYTFSPRVNTTFDAECLIEIADFISQKTQEHKS